ncbi:MAG: hypothetical protein ACRDGV_05910 [Candidatus Limnocylindria bacterium]
MITRILGDRRTQALTRRVDRPAVYALAAVQAGIAAAGWLAEPLWLAVAIAAQLAVGALIAGRIIGPARAGLGLARYAMPATAGVAATLFGRLLPGGLSLLLVPLVAVLLWSVVYLELRAERLVGGRTLMQLLMTTILFAAAAGILELLGASGWPPPVALVALPALILGLRDAEGRGVTGVQAVGQTLLHVLAVMQVATASLLLDLPIPIVPALVALTFYAWGGAVESLQSGASGRSVAVEFGALGMLGLLIALLLHRG